MSARLLLSSDSIVRVPADAPAAAELQRVARAVVEETARHGSALQHDASAEAILKLRVSLRRLRSLLWAFAPVLPKDKARIWRRSLADMTKVAGYARDWDVLISDIVPAAQLPQALDADALLDALKQRRDAAWRNGHHHLAAADLPTLLQDCLRAIEHAEIELLDASGAPTARRFAQQCLQKTARLVQRRTEKAYDGELGALHDARNAIKRLRYLTELFQPLLKPKDLADLRTLIKLQSQLGRLNDLAVAKDYLAYLRDDDALKPALDFLVAWLDERIASQSERVRKLLKQQRLTLLPK